MLVTYVTQKTPTKPFMLLSVLHAAPLTTLGSNGNEMVNYTHLLACLIIKSIGITCEHLHIHITDTFIINAVFILPYCQIWQITIRRNFGTLYE